MLRTLDIRDVLIIDHLELTFRPGLNVLTGETGAGKSILLDALGFALGWRGKAELVRAGRQTGEVTAVFEIGPDHPVRAILEEAGLEAEGELILRRVNRQDGRKTAWVNDRRVSGEVLRHISDRLVELHGQQDDRGLLNAGGHRGLLDDFAGHGDVLEDVRTTWTARRAAETALERSRARLAEARAEEAFLRHSSAELDALDPQPGEEAELDQRRRTIQGAGKIKQEIAKAAEALGLDGAEGRMSDARRWLEDVADRLGEAADAPLDALDRAGNDLAKAQDGVAELLDALTFDAHELETVEERLFAIRALARKHGVLADTLGDFAAEMRGRLAVLDRGAEDLAACQAALDAAEKIYEAAAAALTDARRKAAGLLDAAMARELEPLKLGQAVFSTAVSAGEPGPAGRDVVRFVAATNPGAPSGPLDKIASGGELSRFLLALKVCLTRAAGGLVLIFDEIDRGVGGATADAVGRRLAQLAEGGQVLVVTHSPQVAAQGTAHLRVEKVQKRRETLSTVTDLDPSARVDEIARMLSGDVVTEAARAAAETLIAGRMRPH